MKTSITILENNLDVEYAITITAGGSPELWSAYGGDPAEPAEFDIEIIELSFPKQHADVHLDLPTWLNDLITTHLLERDDINEIAQRMDHERGSDYED